MSVFDGLAEIFAETFGEPVVYVPKATGIPLGATGTIGAIWIETPSVVVQGEADSDAIVTELHVPAAVVPDPKEGDLATRVKTGKTCRVVPPIRPDGQGMIACGLEIIVPSA